jgi:hypothetical protein
LTRRRVVDRAAGRIGEPAESLREARIASGGVAAYRNGSAISPMRHGRPALTLCP